DVDFHEAVRLAVENGAIDPAHLLRKRVHGDAPRFRLARVETDMGNLRIGVGTPGDRQGARLAAAEEERILKGEARQRIGGMGELETRANVARGKDATITRLK